MNVRSTTVHADPEAIDDGAAFLRDKVLPAMSGVEGCIGLSMLAERENGRCITATAWKTEEAMKASAPQIRPLRDRMVQVLGGKDPEVQEWEIALVHRERPAGDGADAQVAWSRIQPSHVQDLLEAYRANLMPKLQELPGFCSLSLMVDRRNGRTVSVTSFESREALALVKKEARLLRAQFAQAMGARIVDVAEMDLVVARLRVPETV